MERLGVVDCIRCGGEVHLRDDTGEFERLAGLATGPACVSAAPTIDLGEIFWAPIALVAPKADLA